MAIALSARTQTSARLDVTNDPIFQRALGKATNRSLMVSAGDRANELNKRRNGIAPDAR